MSKSHISATHDSVRFAILESGAGITAGYTSKRDTTLYFFRWYSNYVSTLRTGLDIWFEEADSLSVGDVATIWMSHSAWLTSPVDTMLLVSRVTRVDSLTIATHDTLTGVADSFYTDAFFGRYDYADLFANVTVANATTAAAYGAGRQYKVGGLWYTPMDSARKKVEVLKDSATVKAADSLLYLRSASAVHADSSRFVFWGKTYFDSVWRKIIVYLSN